MYINPNYLIAGLELLTPQQLDQVDALSPQQKRELMQSVIALIEQALNTYSHLIQPSLPVEHTCD